MLQKLIIFILAAVVMAGSLAPCCVGDECQDEISHTEPENRDEEDGPCSPFFACGSCANGAQLVKHYSVPTLIAEPPTHYEKISSHFYSTYQSALFKPPRNNASITI